MVNPSRWLFVVLSEPYSHGLQTDPAIDAIMAAGAFGQRVSVIFMCEGLGYLSAATVPPPGQSDLRKLLKSLPLYDIDNVYFLGDSEADPTRNSGIPATAISLQEARTMIESSHHVVSF